jgi:hypothetical protein
MRQRNSRARESQCNKRDVENEKIEFSCTVSGFQKILDVYFTGKLCYTLYDHITWLGHKENVFVHIEVNFRYTFQNSPQKLNTFYVNVLWDGPRGNMHALPPSPRGNF